jgi:hypothetical protein
MSRPKKVLSLRFVIFKDWLILFIAVISILAEVDIFHEVEHWIIESISLKANPFHNSKPSTNPQKFHSDPFVIISCNDL